MPFNPRIRNRVGEILLAKQQMGQDSLMKGAQTLANAFSKERERVRMTQDKLDSLMGRMQFYKDKGMISEAELNQLAGMPSNKAAGYLESFEADLARRARSRGGSGGGFDASQVEPKPLMTPDGKLIGYMVQTSRGGGQVVRPPAEQVHSDNRQPLGASIEVDGGRILIEGHDRYGTPKTKFIKESDDERMARIQREKNIAGKQGELAELESKINRGNKRWGPDFLPFMPSYEDQAARKRAEIQALQGNKGEKASDEESLLEQARDAIRRGAPRDAVIQRLRERGIQPTGI